MVDYAVDELASETAWSPPCVSSWMRGESEAIVLAYETGTRIILDDRKAREAARRLGVPVTGTVGLILKAKQAGVIPVIRPLLDALDANQIRIGEALRAEALRLAGE